MKKEFEINDKVVLLKSCDILGEAGTLFWVKDIKDPWEKLNVRIANHPTKDIHDKDGAECSGWVHPDELLLLIETQSHDH